MQKDEVSEVIQIDESDTLLNCAHDDRVQSVRACHHKEVDHMCTSQRWQRCLRIAAWVLFSIPAIAVSSISCFAIFNYISHRIILTYNFESNLNPLVLRRYDDIMMMQADDATLTTTNTTIVDDQWLYSHSLLNIDGEKMDPGHAQMIVNQISDCSLIINSTGTASSYHASTFDAQRNPCLVYRILTLKQHQNMALMDNNNYTFTICHSTNNLEYAVKFLDNLALTAQFAEHHRYLYVLRLVTDIERDGRHPSFGRALVVHELLQLLPTIRRTQFHHDRHYVFFLDTDAHINTDLYLSKSLSSIVRPTADIHFQGENTFCACVFLARRSSLVLWFLRHVWDEGRYEHTREHTWEQKAFTHTINILLSGQHGFRYTHHCLKNDCEPLGFAGWSEDFSRLSMLWDLDWGPIAFWPLNYNNSLLQPQVHQCMWKGCPKLHGLVVHDGQHS